MHRFIVSKPSVDDVFVTLPDGEAFHAVQVLRLNLGVNVELLDTEGGRYEGQIVEVGKRAVVVKIVVRKFDVPPLVEIVLGIALLKGKAMDWVWPKATELGARQIIPLLTERCVAPSEKTEKWQNACYEAAKQCGNTWPAKVRPTLRLSEFIRTTDFGSLALVASLQDTRKEIRDVVNVYVREQGKLPLRMAMLVGPEGDFSPNEYGQITGAGFVPVTLGDLVLRAETAATTGLSLLQAAIREHRTG